MNPRSQLLAAALVALATPAFAATYNFSSGVYAPGVTAPNPLLSPDVLEINAGGFKYFDAVTATNQSGTVNWNANELYFQNGAVFNNASLWDAKSNDGLVHNGGAVSTFNNTGTFRKSAGVGTTTVGAIAFVNSGTIDAQTGLINFSGGNATFNAGTTFTGAGATRVSSNAAFNGAFTSSNLSLTAGTFTGTNAGITGTVNLTGGALVGTWTVNNGQLLTVNAGGFKYLDGAATTLTNNGTLQWSTTNEFYLQNGAALINNGLYDVQATSGIVNNGGTTPTFTNSATGTLRAAAGQTATIGAVAFTNNGGTLTADGTLRYSGGNATFNAGTLFNGTGTNLVANHASFNGALTSGNLLLQSGNYTGGAAVLSGTTALTGGAFLGNWTLAAGHTLNVSAGGFKYLDGATFTNHGLVQWQTGNDFYLQNGAAFSNTGTFHMQAGATLVNNGGVLSSMTNTGTLSVADGQSGIVGAIAFVNNGGTLSAGAGGTLTFSGGNAAFNHGSTFAGAGAIAITNHANFAGTQNSSNLSLRGGTLTGNNALLQGTAELTGGRLAGTWTLANGATLTAKNGAFKYLDGASTVFNNNGTFAWQTGNSFYFENGATLNNTGLFDMQTGATLTHNGGAATTFNNTGTLRVAAGQTSAISGGNFAFVNNGGTVDVGAGGTLNLNNGNNAFNAGTQFTGAGAAAVNNNANFNGSFTSQNLSLRAGTFTGSNAVANGSTEVTGGRFTGTWNIASGATLTARDGGFKYLDGATVVNNGTFTWQTTNSLYFENGSTLNNAGTLNIATDGDFVHNGGATSAIINTGTFQKTGGAGNSNINIPFTNNGVVNADSGRLTFNTGSGIQGTGTLNIGTVGAVTLNGPSTVGVLNHNGGAAGSLTLGANTVTVSSDYNNANFGTGNSFDRRANVSTSGVGNRILAAGDVNQGVSGAGVTNGTTATPTLTVGNVRVGTNALSYNIDNTGTTGPALRGAIQTSVNGGSITDARLSGSGVTAGNWGPVAAGASAAQDVTFTVNSAGVYAPLAGQAVSIVNNFDNTRSQVLTINSAAGAAAYQAAQANTLTNPVNLGNVRVGGTLATNLSITNVAPNTGGYTETLGATVTGTTGGVVTAGAVNALAQGATSTAISAGFNTTTAGARSGSVTVGFTSNEINNSGLGTIGVGSQTVNLTGGVYRLAEATLGTINFGNVLVGSSQTQFLSVSNSALADGFSEGLNATLGAFSGASAGLLSGSGAITNLAAGGSNNTTLAVTLNTNSAGTVTASVQVLLASNGSGTSGLGLLALPSQNVPISGLIQANVGNLASASAVTPNPVNLGNVRVGDAAPSQTLSLTNVQVGPAEGLNASISTATPGLTATGSFANLAPGATNSSSLSVSMNTATAGSRNGTATIALASDGSFNSGVETALPSQTVNVTGAVYQAAQAGALPTLIDLGTVRSGTVVNAALAISNVAPNTGGFTETLGAGFGTVSAGLAGSGSASGVGSGATSNAMSLQFTAGPAGAYSGNATVNFVSQEINGSGLGNLALASQMVNVTADVNAIALLGFQNNSAYSFTPINASSALLDFGTISSVSSLMASLELFNGAFGPSDTLVGSLDLTGLIGSVFSVTGGSSFNLAAGEGLPFSVVFNPTGAGLFSATFAITSASHNPFQTDLSLGTYSITVRGRVAGGGSAVPDSSVTFIGALTLAIMLAVGHRQRRRENAAAAL